MILALEILFALAFAVFVAPMPSQAGETGSNYSFQSGNGIINQYTYQYQTPTYAYPTPAPVYPTPVQAYNPTTTRIVYYPAAETTPKKSTPASTTTKIEDTVEKTTVTEDQTDNKYGTLAASAIFGDSGFLPTGLVQWILVAILILLIVVLVRRVFGGAKSYFATPLKHS